MAKDYMVLNSTFRIYKFLKNNSSNMYNITEITKEIGYNNISIIKPRLLFLIKLNLIIRIKPKKIDNKSNGTKYYKFNR